MWGMTGLNFKQDLDTGHAGNLRGASLEASIWHRELLGDPGPYPFIIWGIFTTTLLVYASYKTCKKKDEPTLQDHQVPPIPQQYGSNDLPVAVLAPEK
mmetsp:Transcript_11302/g.19954  ORF Transcript_11302/g.19954 Transcript_11302/m.19954 type:complete len:98 (+) Transcript_11302:202-495(+)